MWDWAKFELKKAKQNPQEIVKLFCIGQKYSQLGDNSWPPAIYWAETR